jgi:hypothetical protein
MATSVSADSNKSAAKICQGKGTVVLDQVPLVQAKKDALEAALADALSRAQLEITEAFARAVQSGEPGDSTSRFQSVARFTRSVSRGRIIDYTETFSGMIETVATGPAGETKIHAWEVRVSARVQPDIGESDPGFRLQLSLDRASYRESEPMTLKVIASRDCYVTIFNLYANDSLSVIFPNSLVQDNFVAKGDTLILPPPRSVWRIAPTLLEGHVSDHEALLTVATKEPIPFQIDGLLAKRGLCSMGDALLAINRWLVDIELNQRATELTTYTVFK